MPPKLNATYAAVMGSVLAQERKKRQLGETQSDIAKACGISRSSWSRMENGDMVPDALQIRRIEVCFGLEPGGFMAKVDQCCKKLVSEGVEIEDKKKEGNTAGLLLLGATLAALVGIAVAGNSSETDAE